MNRTKYRVILPKTVKTIPNEGLLVMEAERIGLNWRIVSYLSQEDFDRQFREDPSRNEFVDPLTGESGELDKEWRDQFNLMEVHRLSLRPIYDSPGIHPVPSEVLVSEGDQLIAHFCVKDSEGILYEREKSLDYAEMLVEQLKNNRR